MNNPLLNALSKKASPKFGAKKIPLIHIEAPPSTFHLTTKDLPSLKKKKPGDKIIARLHGKIHSMDSDGNVVLHVNDVFDGDSPNPQDDEENEINK